MESEADLHAAKQNPNLHILIIVVRQQFTRGGKCGKAFWQ
jgi:hypothetical protein